MADPVDASTPQPPAEASPVAADPAAGPGTPAPADAAPQAAAPAAAPAAATDRPESRSADITAGPGGVMTDEVGVVTGELTLRSELSAGTVTLRVQYKDADEWYTVTGARAPLHDPTDLDALHAIAVALLNRPEG